MTIYTKQEVSNVHMHIDSSNDVHFEVRHIVGTTASMRVRMTDWGKRETTEFDLYASDDQLRDLEHALHVYNMERTMEKDTDSNIQVSRSEKVTA
jgi:hypothetical protein